MAPGVSGACAAHPGGPDRDAAPAPGRGTAGEAGGCRRRTGAAGMVPAKSVLCAGILLLVRCAAAAEEPAFASGSSFLTTEPIDTAGSFLPSADTSSSVLHSDVRAVSEGGGLRGRPAFASILTFQHPPSLDQSRTSPTITREKNHTSRRPSEDANQGSEMSSSSSLGTSRNLFTSSGLTFSMPASQHHSSSSPSSSSSSPSPSSSASASSASASSSSAPFNFNSTKSASSLSMFTDNQSSQSRQSSLKALTSFMFSPSSSSSASATAALEPAGSQHRTNDVTSARPTLRPLVDLPTINERLFSSNATVAPTFPPETVRNIRETSPKGQSMDKTPPSLSSLWASSQGVSTTLDGTVKQILSHSAKLKSTTTRSTSSPFTSHQGEIPVTFSGKATQTQRDMNTILADGNGRSTYILSSYDKNIQGDQSQQRASQNPTSAMLLMPAKHYWVSSHITREKGNEIPDRAEKDKTRPGSQTFNVGTMPPVHSHVINPGTTPAMTSRFSGPFFTIPWRTLSTMLRNSSPSEMAITKLTAMDLGVVSSENASSPVDLQTAAGGGRTGSPIPIMNNSLGGTVGAELISVSGQTRQNSSPSWRQTRSESASPIVSSTNSFTHLTHTDKSTKSRRTNAIISLGDPLSKIYEELNTATDTTFYRKSIPSVISVSGETQQKSSPGLTMSSSTSQLKSSTTSELDSFHSPHSINVQQFITQAATLKGTPEERGWTMLERILHSGKIIDSNSSSFAPLLSQSSSSTLDTGEANVLDQTKPLFSSQMTPSKAQKLPFTRPSRSFITGPTLPPHPVKQAYMHLPETSAQAMIKETDHGISEAPASQIQFGQGKVLLLLNSLIHMTHADKPTERSRRNTINILDASSSNLHEELNTATDTTFYRKSNPSLISVSGQTQQNSSPSWKQTRSEAASLTTSSPTTQLKSSTTSQMESFYSPHSVILREFITQAPSQGGASQERRWTMLKTILNSSKIIPSNSSSFAPPLSKSFGSTFDTREANVLDQTLFSTQMTPSETQRLPLTRPSRSFNTGPTLLPHPVEQAYMHLPETSTQAMIKEETKHSFYTTPTSQILFSRSMTELLSNSFMHKTHTDKPTKSSRTNTINSLGVTSSNVHEELNMATDAKFYRKSVPSLNFTTRLTSSNTLKDFSLFKTDSGRYPKLYLTTFPPFHTVPSEDISGTPKHLTHKNDVTHMGRQEKSQWSESILPLRPHHYSHSQQPLPSGSSDKSEFYLSRKTASSAILFAVSTISINGEETARTDNSIFSSGTTLTSSQQKGKTTSLVFLPSGSHKSASVSVVDSINSHTTTNSLSSVQYSERGKHTMSKFIVLNSTWGLTPPPTIRLSSPVASSEPPQATKDSPAASTLGLDVSFSPSHTTDGKVTSSPASSLGSLHSSNNKHHNVPPGTPSATEITLPNRPAASVTAITSNRVDSKLKWVFSQSSSHLSSSPSPASSSSSSTGLSQGETIPQLSSSLYINQANPMPFSITSPSSSLSSPLPSSPSPLITSAVITQPSSLNTHAGAALSSHSASTGMSATPPSLPPGLTSLVNSTLLQDATKMFVVVTEMGMGESTTGTSGKTGPTLPKENETSVMPLQSVNNTFSFGPIETTSQVSPLSAQQDTTTASQQPSTTTSIAPAAKTTSTPSAKLTTAATQIAITTVTPQPTLMTRRTATTITTRTPVTRRTFTPPVPRTSPPRGGTTIILSPFTTTTTEAPPQRCNITERMWVKTVVSIYVRRNRLDSIQRQNLRRGLSQGLRKALNDSTAQAQVETVFGSPNMTVAYHVTGGDMVYHPSVVLEVLGSYGRDRLIADLRQYLPMVTALPRPAVLWRSVPDTGFQLKTVLRFVGVGDDPRSCRFSQMMEQRLENVFSEAQTKMLNGHSKLSVQLLSVFQVAGSPAVSLVYTVRNGSVFLNGTAASNLLGQLTAELVGYYLFYPPLIIAEPLEYHNLNTSIATRDFWVITVIQDVDNSSLEGHYQSFASLMELRLAELFVVAGQQGTRFRRATTVGSYTVQMVGIRRLTGMKSPTEMTYYVQLNGVALAGTSAAKLLNTLDSQTMALTLGYFVQLQAEPVVKNPPNNLWILAAVLAPIAVVTLIIIIITAVLCRKNKNDFKADSIGNLNPRTKMAYRRDVGYYHQPVQGFDYAKQHLGRQGGDEETLPVTQDTLMMSLPIRDAQRSLEKTLQQDGISIKKNPTIDTRKSRLPSEDGSVISNESEKLNSSRSLTVQKVTAQQKVTKEPRSRRDDPYDTSSGSLQLISIKQTNQPSYSHPASSDRSQDSVIVNGEVNLALKQKSDIEHYRNKLRLKAKRKGYYDFPSADVSSSQALEKQQRHVHERAPGERGRTLEPDDERGSTYVKSQRRRCQAGQPAYRSGQSLNSPSPGGTEIDLLVMRERPRRGIPNSGYDTEPELIEETNVDRLLGPRGFLYGRAGKGHSETSTLSSQPSIDEVRQQMHLLLEEAFSLASGGHSTSGRHSHHHHHPSANVGPYSPAPPPLPYTDVITSAPGTVNRGRGGLQWVPSYGADVYQCSLPKPAFRFTQLPDMAVGSPPPPLPPRAGPPPGTSLRRSSSDFGPKGRSSEAAADMQGQHENNTYGPTPSAALPSLTAEQPHYSGNPITAVYAIPASRPGYSEYLVSTPPTSYRSPSWMSYPPEPEDVPSQWAESDPLPGYVEAFPRPRYPAGSPARLPLQYNQGPEPLPPPAPMALMAPASKQSPPRGGTDMDSVPLSSLSTSALVQAIRQEVAKLAKKQSDMFEFHM